MSFRSYLLSALTLISGIFPHTNAEASTNKIRIAVFVDKGAHARKTLISALRAAPDMTITKVYGEDLRAGELKDFDLLLVPGGSAKKESFSMQAEGREEVRRFIHNGGLYLGICAGCYLLTEAKPTDLGLLPLDTVDKAHWARGKGRLPVELTPFGKEVFGTQESMFDILYHNGPVIDASHVTPESQFTPLAYFRGELVGEEGKKGLMVNKPAMFLGKFGQGLVMGISPHPEASSDQVFMITNGIRWLYNQRHSKSNQPTNINTQNALHLMNLRNLLETVAPEDSSYRHHDSVVLWKGQDGAEKAVSHADCSSLLNKLLEYTYGISPAQLKAWLGGRVRPHARNYYQAILNQNRFQRIRFIQQILPGDIIAMRYLHGHGDKARDTGHVMVINGLPRQIKSNLEYYQRWSVAVIDSSGGHGKKDTRFRNGESHSGLGEGDFSLYSKSDGTIVGYSWTTSDSSKFYDDTARPLVVGRLK